MILSKFKKIKGLRGDVLEYIAQVILQVDAEIVKKGSLWMETKQEHLLPVQPGSESPVPP